MSMKPAKVQFNGGELSPWLEGRFDIAKFDKTAKLCRNFIPLAEGSLKRRGGTHFAATTPYDDDIFFEIDATPKNAKIIINDEEQTKIAVARGDVVTFEVSAEGYAFKSGRFTVTENTKLKVNLISQTESFNLTIVPTPVDAVVKINGYVQNSAEVFKNDTATYVVYKDGYELQQGSVVITEDKIISVVLKEDEQEAPSYGDWGNLVGFVACSAVGYDQQQWKCFYIRFTNGYLPVIFSAFDEAPTDPVNESLFFRSIYDGYNSVVYRDEVYTHTYVYRTNKNAIIWMDKDGNYKWAIDPLTAMLIGYQVDDNGRYAAVYDTYYGVVSSNVLKVYHNNKLVWTLKGRENV